MISLPNLSLKQKLTLIILGASTIALLMACTALVSFELTMLRGSMKQNLSTLAAILGDSAGPAIYFMRPEDAGEILSGLNKEPHIEAACLYDEEGTVAAQYVRPSEKARFKPPVAQAGACRFDRASLVLFHRFSYQDKVYTIYLQSDLGELQVRIRLYATISGLVLVVSFLVSGWLSLTLQKIISQPILNLAKTAYQVSTEKNYAVRAPQHARDEIGRLTDGFNEMLTQIQARDEAIHESRQQFLTLVNSIEGIVWQMDLKTRQFSFVSEQARGLLGYPTELWLRDPAFWAEHICAEDRPRATDFFRRSLDRNLSHHLEYRMFTATQHIRWIRHSTTVVVEDGKPVLVCGVLLDVTEQKMAEQELDSLHRQLLENSRLSGMAEVATGVLHNVGNVLNSVNVSTTLVYDRLRESKIASLGKAACLLREHEADLAAFLSGDPRGRRIPSFLTNLAQHLEQEQATLVEEMRLLAGNVEHIKHIVTMQQSYAKVSGMVESLPIATVVEDALKMNGASFQRHRIQVVRAYQEVPPVSVEKHKVLQILLNLIQNATQAMAQKAGPYDKHLRIGIGPAGDDRLEISVQDNGVGIPPENLTRIFAHGFTTKKDGHGFGLHMGALAAKEMGGSLRAHSDGPGQGARFVLELPIDQPANSHGTG